MNARPCTLLAGLFLSVAACGCRPLNPVGVAGSGTAVRAGEDSMAELDGMVTLEADVGGLTDGYAFRWSQESGPAVELADPTAAVTEAGPFPILGEYKFRVIASTASAFFGQDYVVVTVVEKLPGNDNADENVNENADENTNENTEENVNDNADENINENTEENVNGNLNDNAPENINENVDDGENVNDNTPPELPEDTRLRANAPDTLAVNASGLILASDSPVGFDTSYRWRVISGEATVSDPSAATSTVTPTAEGTVQLRAVMTIEDTGQRFTNEVSINAVPEGTVFNYIDGPTVIGVGSPSHYRQSIVNNPVGSAILEDWTVVIGRAEILDPNSIDPKVVAFEPGDLVIQAQARDGVFGGDYFDKFTIIVAPQLQLVTDGSPESFALLSEPTPLAFDLPYLEEDKYTFSWRVTSGDAVIDDPAALTPTVTMNEIGTAVLELTATHQNRSELTATREAYLTTARDEHPRVVIDVEGFGQIPIELDPVNAPVTVANFLHYVDDHFYDDHVFHRVIADFIVQGGPFKQGAVLVEDRGPIKNESLNGLSNVRGTISMALQPDDPESGSSGFFINLSDDNVRLDELQHTVFGRVVDDGMDVVDRISLVETGPQDNPQPPVVINSIRRVDAG